MAEEVSYRGYLYLINNHLEDGIIQEASNGRLTCNRATLENLRKSQEGEGACQAGEILEARPDEKGIWEVEAWSDEEREEQYRGRE